MDTPAQARLDATIKLRRFSAELEFIGEPNEAPAEVMAERIAAMRMEMEDAVRSTRALLALARLNRLG